MHENILNALAKGREKQQQEKEQRISEYNQNPVLCPNCNTVIPYENYLLRKYDLSIGKIKRIFCDRSCAAKFNNKTRIKEKAKCINCDCKLNTGKKYCSYKCHKEYQRTENDKAVIKGEKTAAIKVMKRLIIERDGRVCCICKNTEWMGQPVPIILDHIDGNPYNDDMKNLRLVCGNCDMQLPTYKSKNNGNGRHERRKRYEEGKSY